MPTKLTGDAVTADAAKPQKGAAVQEYKMRALARQPSRVSNSGGVARLRVQFSGSPHNPPANPRVVLQAYSQRFRMFLRDFRSVLKKGPYVNSKNAALLLRKIAETESSFSMIPSLPKVDTTSVRCSRINRVLQDFLEQLTDSKGDRTLAVLINQKIAELRMLISSVSSQDIKRSTAFFESQRSTQGAVRRLQANGGSADGRPLDVQLSAVVTRLVRTLESYVGRNEANFSRVHDLAQSGFFDSPQRFGENHPVVTLLGHLRNQQQSLRKAGADVPSAISSLSVLLEGYKRERGAQGREQGPQDDVALAIDEALRGLSHLEPRSGLAAK